MFVQLWNHEKVMSIVVIARTSFTTLSSNLDDYRRVSWQWHTEEVWTKY